MGDRVAHGVAWAVEAVLWPFDHLPPLLALTLLGALTALFMLAVIKRVAPQAPMSRARDRMAACIYEMRLFLDEPRRVLSSQGRLLGWTGLYLACLLPAALTLFAPLGLLFVHLESHYGLAPLAAHTTVVVRVGLGDDTDGREVEVAPADPGVKITAPLLYARDEQALYARVLVGAAGTHAIAVRAGSQTVKKTLVADPAARNVVPVTRGGWAQLWTAGAEPPPPGGAIESVTVPYPALERHWLGLPIPWWLYWLGVAMAVALALRRRLGVAL